MSYSKPVLTVVVVLMILSLNFSAAGAQAGEPDGEVDAWSDLPEQAVIPDGTIDGEATIGVDRLAYPIYPYYNIVHSKNPAFYFRRDNSAAKYVIEVSLLEGATLYSLKDTGTCNAYACWLQPTTKLTFAGKTSPGAYEWRVASVINGVPQPFSSYAEFWVYSKGFNSPFDANYNKWKVRYGPWYWLEDKGQLMTLGDAGKYNSLYYSDYFITFDYTVRMKRKNNPGNTNAVVVWGDPMPATTAHNWSDGIYVFYTNSGDFGVMRFETGKENVMLALFFDCPAVIPYGWNEIRVVGASPYLDFWLNGTYLGWVETTNPGNNLGVDMFSTGAADEKFLVDWAKASILTTTDSLIHDPSMRLGVACSRPTRRSCGASWRIC